MSISHWRKCVLLNALILSALTAVTAGATDSRPNILLIVVDDLGYSEIGAFGGEIETPHLDALVHLGRHLASMYVAPTCSPTRSMLMSGMDHHLVGLGNMAEMMNPALPPEHMGTPGDEGWLSERLAVLPELMQAAGYRTLMAGKWHLGARDGYRPEQCGFDHAWALMDGGAAHFKQSAPQSISAGAPARPAQGRMEDCLQLSGQQVHLHLYNLCEAPGELRDLSEVHSAKRDELLTEWTHYIQRNNVIWTGRDTTCPRGKH